MNHEHAGRRTPLPLPGPDCAAWAPRLPLLAQGMLPDDEAARLRTHAATCVHCQALLAAYARLDAALVRHFAPPQDDPVRLTEEIMDHIEEQTNPFPPAPPTPAPAPTTPAPLPAHGARARISLLAAVAAVLALAVVAAALLAGRGLGVRGLLPTGQLPPLRHATPIAHPSARLIVDHLAMMGPDDGWAFGTYSTAACSLPPHYSATPSATPPWGPDCTTIPVALHYDGRNWARASIPTTGAIMALSSQPGGQTVAIALPASYSIVAHWPGGYNPYALQSFPGATQTWLRYASGQWLDAGIPGTDSLAQSVPNADGFDVTAFAMVSRLEGWAVGGYDKYNSGAYGLLVHFTQGHWTQATISGDARDFSLQAISMLSPNEGWAVGVIHADPQMVVILHYHDGQWTREDPGIPGSLNAVYAVSPAEAWAVGSANPSTGPGLILHYLNGTWTAVTGLQTNILHGITMVSANEGWAVGDGAMFLHYHNGQWTNVGVVIHQFELDSVAMASPTDGWAIGGACCTSEPGSLAASANLFHYDGARWAPYSLAALLPQFAQG